MNASRTVVKPRITRGQLRGSRRYFCNVAIQVSRHALRFLPLAKYSGTDQRCEIAARGKPRLSAQPPFSRLGMPNATHNQLNWHSRLLGIVLLLVSIPQAYSQQYPSPGKPLTLDEAISFGLSHYPAVRVSLERMSAAKEGVGFSRMIYLPRADLLWQSNRATRNNIFGALLPQSIVPPISGPVLPSTSDGG